MKHLLKKRCFYGLLVRAVLTVSLCAMSNSAWSFELKDIERDRGNFLLGFFTGYAAHELGHILVADSLGYDSEFEGVTIIYPEANLEDKDLVRISSAGLQFQWIASEIAFGYREGGDLSIAADNYSAGVIAAHIAISAAYLTILRDHKDGDIVGLAKGTGFDKNELALTLAIPAMLDTWRLFGNDTPDWLPVVSAGSKALGLTWIWTFE